MAMSQRTHNVYLAVFGVAVAIAVGCGSVIAVAGDEATPTTRFDPTTAGMLSVIVVGGIFLAVAVWVLVGLITPLWGLPEIRDGPTLRKRIVQKREIARAVRERDEKQRASALVSTWRELSWCEALIRDAVESGTYWPRETLNPVEHGFRWLNNRRILAKHADLEPLVVSCDDAYAGIERVVALDRNAGEIRSEDALDTALERISGAKGHFSSALIPGAGIDMG